MSKVPPFGGQPDGCVVCGYKHRGRSMNETELLIHINDLKESRDYIRSQVNYYKRQIIANKGILKDIVSDLNGLTVQLGKVRT